MLFMPPRLITFKFTLFFRLFLSFDILFIFLSQPVPSLFSESIVFLRRGCPLFQYNHQCPSNLVLPWTSSLSTSTIHSSQLCSIVPFPGYFSQASRSSKSSFDRAHGHSLSSGYFFYSSTTIHMLRYSCWVSVERRGNFSHQFFLI